MSGCFAAQARTAVSAAFLDGLDETTTDDRSAVLRSRLGGGQDNLVESYESAAPSSPLTPLLGQSMQGRGPFVWRTLYQSTSAR